MSNYYVALVLIFFTSCISRKNVQKCIDVKTGSFKVLSERNTEYLITRTDRFQIEDVKEFGVKIRFDVQWVDDCTYKLFNKKGIQGKHKLSGEKNDTITCQIISVKENIVRVRTSSNFSDLINEVELKRIKKKNRTDFMIE